MSQRSREVKDLIGEKSMWIFTVLTIVLLFLIAIGLFYKSLPILKVNSLSELLFSSEWYPLKGKFGLWPFILSTLWVTGISIFLAVPLCLLASIYLSEYADRRILQYVNPL